MSDEESPDPLRVPDRGEYRRKVRRCLDTLARMLSDGSFSFAHKHIGLELELNLVDEQMRPSMTNTMVLAAIDDPSFTTELSRHNLELNVAARPLAGDSALHLADELTAYLATASQRARQAHTAVAMIGILPTITSEHFDQKWLTDNYRYSLLNDEILAARGERTALAIEGAPLPGAGAERLRSHADSILPEAACTSLQLHLQVPPEEFAEYWNAAQALSGIQVAIGANSPFLLGKALWHETRIPLFQQATDTRPEELKNQGVRPRVWFGERWVSSIFDLFEENVRYFPGLLPETDSEDPLEALESGRVPKLHELRLHNGTVWRWNRPVYDVVDETPHLRVENRVLAAGPTVADMLANAAFFYGAQRALVEQNRPVWTRMSFQAAADNLYAGARDGFDATLYWPDVGAVTPDELVLRVLLPLAHDGLRSAGVSEPAIDHYLGLVERRCLARRSGSVWQRDTVAALQRRGCERPAALSRMLARYMELSETGEPAHTWPV